MHVTTPFLNLRTPTPPLSLESVLLVYQAGGPPLLLRATPQLGLGRVTLRDARPVTDDLARHLLQDVLRQRERMTLVDHARERTAPGVPLRAPGPPRAPVLTRLLLIYHNQKQAVVLSARPRLHGGELTLSPPAPVREGELLDLLAQLQTPPAPPDDPAVVGYSRQGVAWFVPAGPRRLLLQTPDPALNALSGQAFPQPPLLMIAGERGQLRVFALKDDQRPTPGTPLCAAPYYNVGQSGYVCLGTTVCPRGERALDTALWTTAFFSSHFTHANASQLSEFRGTHAELWLAARERGSFDPAWLKPTGMTLEENLCGT